MKKYSLYALNEARNTLKNLFNANHFIFIYNYCRVNKAVNGIKL